MGMIANYQPTTDIELEKIMCLDDVEELQERDIEICDIDKMGRTSFFTDGENLPANRLKMI